MMDSRLRRLVLCLGVAVAHAGCSLGRTTFTPVDGTSGSPDTPDTPDAAPPSMPAAEDCSTVGDEDGNGLADCADPACGGEPACQPGTIPRIRVTTTGAGHGTITATVADATCDAACLDSLPDGAPILLTAAADSGSWFRGWVAGCDGRQSCQVVAADGLTITGDFTPQPNRVFLSSTTHDGNFGGLAGGDKSCQDLATQAGLTGTYQILLSTESVLALQRLNGAEGWIRVDDQPSGDPAPGLVLAQGTDGHGLFNLRLDERGIDLGVVSIWTPNAPSSGTSCSAWSSNVGGAGADSLANVDFSVRTARPFSVDPRPSQPCSQKNHFLCAEVDRHVGVFPVSTSGRLAFATIAMWDPTSGIAAADALCTAEAAGRPGTFQALLATPTRSAIARFDTSGKPWVRVDGMPLLPTALRFQTADFLDIAPGVRIDGSLQPVQAVIALGASSFHTPGTNTTTCNNWTSSTNASAQGFLAWDTDPGLGSSSCTPLPVLCLEN